MRRRFFSLLVLGLALGFAARALAGEVPFSGALSLSFGAESAMLPGAGAVRLSQDGPTILRSLGAEVLTEQAVPVPLHAFSAAGVVLDVTDPAVQPIRGVLLSGRNLTGDFAGAPLVGNLPLEGFARICLFGPCGAAVANLTVPFSLIGENGFVTQMIAGLNMTVVGAPWTTGTVAIGTVQRTGVVLPSGASLVTPVFISSNLPATRVIPGFGILDVIF